MCVHIRRYRMQATREYYIKYLCKAVSAASYYHIDIEPRCLTTSPSLAWNISSKPEKAKLGTSNIRYVLSSLCNDKTRIINDQNLEYMTGAIWTRGPTRLARVVNNAAPRRHEENS